MPKGKYKRLHCHIKILKNNLKHKKFTIRDAIKSMFIFEFRKLLRERIKKIRNTDVSDDRLSELISTGKSHYIKKRKIPRIEDYTPPMWHLWVYGGCKKNQFVKEKTVNKTTLENILIFSKKELKEKMLRILKERGQNPDYWNFYAWFKTVNL
ncbi:unnamed protein product [marine sediment metagenome]|uniref:Uncharacterized protein n=1 Tax=marine sediment metagenome TaxID=412755 RepID=X1CYA3_9ZZZZ